MKKGLLLIGCLFLGISSANALTLNDDGSYTNNQGAKITTEQYEYLSRQMKDRSIDILSQNGVDIFSNPLAQKEIDVEYTITTDTIKNGEIVDSITITATKEEAKTISENANLHVLADKKIHDTSNMPSIQSDDDWIYQTSSKMVKMFYGTLYGQRCTYMDVEWYKIPMIKKYDILAFRWEKSIPSSSIYNYQASQVAYDKDGNWLQANYDKSHANLKITNYGIAQIMNIYDAAATHLSMDMYLDLKESVGTTVYGTYQHARNSNITLSQAKSFTFKSTGLGKVLYFSNSTVRNYYDGMQGVQSSGYGYEW